MKVNQARDYLYENLKHLGCIKWHNNSTSYYLKFNDCRIGSIRLSNHKSRKIYNYKINLIEPQNNFKKYRIYSIFISLLALINLQYKNPIHIIRKNHSANMNCSH